MRTPDEIKKGLEVCNIWMVDEPNRCMECPYFCTKDCADTLMKHSLALIQQLQAENAEQAEKIRKLEAERDAAVADIRLAFTSYVGTCQTCKHGENQVDCIEPLRCGNCENEKCKCQSCDIYDSNWEWRGVQKEETP